MAQDSLPSTELNRLARLIRRVAAALSLAVLVAAPTIYFVMDLGTEYAIAQLEVDRAADMVSQRIFESPRMWRFEEHRMVGMLERFRPAANYSRFEIYDDRDQLIAAVGFASPAIAIRREASLMDGFSAAGKVVLYREPIHAYTELAIGFLYGLALAAMLQAVLRILPLRALRHAGSSIAAYQAELRDRVAELERTKDDLEAKSAELRRLLVHLGEARDEADRANRIKSEFLTAMSHELRTPLNSIIGFAELLKSSGLGLREKERGYAEIIHGSGHHLLGLINDILDLSRIESGAEELDEDEIDVPDLLDSVIKLMSGQASRRDVRLHFSVEKGLPPLYADGRKVKQILINLLGNAVKFTPAGGAARLRCGLDDGGSYVFEVTDTGDGIAPENIPKVLSQFGRIREPGIDQEGSGLGLPLAKALVEKQGGTLKMKSTVGQGTTVIVSFPPNRTLIGPPRKDRVAPPSPSTGAV